SITELQHLIATKSDEYAYAELFQRFAGVLQRFAEAIINDGGAAEELVSDVFIRVWERRETLDQISNFRMYLYVSVRNYAINHLRAQKQPAIVPLDEIQLNLEDPGQATPLDDTIERQLSERINEAVNQLPVRCRVIFKLAKEDGLRHKEIAELLQLSPKTVENQMTIALRKLGTSLRSYTDRVIRLRS
ncbi:MAG TPA: RNA polymerase sigma-70 factor, partial [Phnomibacter sp.]|nr:RNA polymerase sigma-70 factor [Phnomibacter sp.]